MRNIMSGLLLIGAFLAHSASAGVIDPDCTPEKAVKSAATKATVGVGGRCTAAEAAKDSTKKAVGIEEKGVIEKKTQHESSTKKAIKALTK